MKPNDPKLLIHAAIDGELDAAGAIEIERLLSSDPALAAEYERLKSLRGLVATRLPREVAPQSLHARVASMARHSNHVVPNWFGRFASGSYRALAASLVLGIGLGAGGSWQILKPSADDDIANAVIAGYVRGRISGQPVDVLTSDRHTVKPWLAGRVGTGTTVVDLAKDGFTLVGGRVDVLGTNAVPTLVYQYREHFISLSELSASGASAVMAPRMETRAGYSLVLWSDTMHHYVAVSDLAPAELAAFADIFRKAALSAGE